MTSQLGDNPSAHTRQIRTRDPRLDFYRGLAMFIILIAHIPGNVPALWIPARFGFSDATEIFVFCSGMASAIAFGSAFRNKGWWMGTARVALRIWQVYWAHIGVFLMIATFVALLNGTGAFEKDYVGDLNLWPFFDETPANLVGLMTLTYVPNYFDVLPMYIGILAMMPVVVGLQKLHTGFAVGFVLAVWLGANFDVLMMPAEPWTDREWFFNPFGWQLVFFTGFALMSGWLPQPRFHWGLVALAVVFVLATVPFAYFRILNAVPELKSIAKDIHFLTQKTDFGVLRYVHFMALAYLGWAIAGQGGTRLLATGSGLAAAVWRFVLRLILKVGQQSLAVFMVSMVLARIIGFGFDQLGRATSVVLLGNLIGFGVIIGVAFLAGWFKSQPWRNKQVAQ